MAAESQHFAINIMGVCGVGKTSVGRTLAARLGARFIEADDYHSDENRNAMAQGIPLSDEMRLPWLERLSVAAETGPPDRNRRHGLLCSQAQLPRFIA